MKKPNILFIVTDQHPLHGVSCYGAPVCRTPNIDFLALDGVKFTRAYTPCSICVPARASILSGLYPHNHGAFYNSGYLQKWTENQIGAGVEMYPARLKDAGYRTGFTGKWHGGLAEKPADVGFEGMNLPGHRSKWDSEDYLDYLKAKGLKVPERIIEWDAQGDNPRGGNISGYLTGSLDGAPMMFLADYTNRMLREYAGDSRPFFLACNFWGPHSPYVPTEDYRDMYDPRDIRPWASFEDDLSGRPAIHRKYRDVLFPEAARADWETWSRVLARCYAQTTMVDTAIGTIINELKNLGIYNDTMIIFTADHGDTCGIHGGAFDKGAMAYEEVYRIPLIVKMPGNCFAGATRDSFVGLIDLADTFCETAGTTMSASDGTSLLGLIENSSLEGREDFFAEFNGHRLPVGQRILWWKDYKYVFNFADTDELYDMASDPTEMNNRVNDGEISDVLAEMKSRMRRQIEGTRDPLGPQWQMFLE